METTVKMDIKLTSSAFKEGEIIPAKFTCDGEDISPPLQWETQKQIKSFAIICDDPDAPKGTWVHWVLFNLPSQTTELKENVPHDEVLPDGSKQGMTDFGRTGYGGPCPPSGIHRYFFKLYGIDKQLDLKPGATKTQVLKAMEGHVICQGQLMGKYKRR